MNSIKTIVNNHNTYFNNLSSKTLDQIAQNYSLYSMYSIIADPINLVQAQSGVDEMTGTFKDIGDGKTEISSPSANLVKSRAPGAFTNKAESISDNQVGKDGIAICATGLKSFFALSMYMNYVLNNKNSSQSDRQKLHLDHASGIQITLPGGVELKPFEYLANVNPEISEANYNLIETLKNSDDKDAALALSALLSLATDNAKELQLAKLNAGTKTIGMYIYGIALGMTEKDVASLLMSPAGLTISEVMNNNMFLDETGAFSLSSAFDYFELGPKSLVKRFSQIDRDEKNKNAKNNTPATALLNYISFAKKGNDRIYKNLPVNETLIARLAWDDRLTLDQKFKLIDSFKYKEGSAAESYYDKLSQLKREFKKYLYQVDKLKQDRGVYESIKTLARGAEEMKTLGQILGLNQGLKTQNDDIHSILDKIENLILKEFKEGESERKRKTYMDAYKSGNKVKYKSNEYRESPIDLYKFCFNDSYQQNVVDTLDNYKHTVNILDCIRNVPNFRGYLKDLAIQKKSIESQSAKFRATRRDGSKIIEALGYTSSRDTKYVYKGLEGFYSNFMRQSWMLEKGIKITLPEGCGRFVNGKISDDISQTEILLGTKDGDATFKLWMETKVIPELKELYSDTNEFIRDLQTNVMTNTVSHNGISVYGLPCNMMPSNDQERAIFNKYKSELNGKLTTKFYSYPIVATAENGIKFNSTKKVPIIDLLYLYGLIAHYGKQGSQSLMPIFENLNKTGIIKEYHDYSSDFSVNRDIIFEEDYTLDEIRPWVMPVRNPYKAFEDVIYGYSEEEMRFCLMRQQKDSDGHPDYSKGKGGYAPITPKLEESQNYYLYGDPDIIEESDNQEKEIKPGKISLGDGMSITYDSNSVIISDIPVGSGGTANLEFENEKLKLITLIKDGVIETRTRAQFKQSDLEIIDLLGKLPVTQSGELDLELYTSYINNFNNPCE